MMLKRLLFAALFSFTSVLFADPELYKIQTASDFPPYSYSNSGVLKGFVIDILNEIENSVSPEFHISAGSAIQPVLNFSNESKIDIAAAVIYDSAYAKDYFFSIPVTYVNYDLFSNSIYAVASADNISIDTILILKGDPVYKNFEHDFPNAEIVEVSSCQSAVKYLANRKYKYALLPKLSALYYLDNSKITNVIFNGIFNYSLPLVFAIKKDNPQLYSRFNDELGILLNSENYYSVVKKWKDIPESNPALYDVRTYVMIVVLLSTLLVVSIILIIALRRKTLSRKNELAKILDVIPHLVYMKDNNGKFTYINRAVSGVYNLPPEQIIGKNQNVIHPSPVEMQKISENEQKVFRNENKSYELTSEETFTDSEGKKHILQTTRVPIKDSNNQYDRVLTVAIDITDRVKNISLLEKSETKFKQLFENAGVCIFIFRYDGSIVDVNSQALKSLGYTKEEILDKKIWEIERQYSAFSLRNLLDGLELNESIELEGFHKRKDGTGYRISARVAPVNYENETVIISIASDIEERKRWEDKIKLQSAALEAAGNGIVIVDRNGIIVWVNKAFTRLTGYTQDEAPGKHTRIFKSGAQNREFYKNLWDTILSGKTWYGTLVNKHKSGRLYIEEASITPVKDEQGEITHFISIKNDVTERKEIEKKITDSEQRYKYLFSKAPIGIFQFDHELVLTAFNDRFIEIFRSTRENLMGLDLKTLNDQAFVPNLHRTLKGEDTQYIGPYRTTTSNMDIFISFYTRAYYNENKQIAGGIGIVEDITQLKVTENELKKSEGKYRSIFENLMDVYYMADANGKLITVSPSAKKLLKIEDEKTLIGIDLASQMYKDPNKRQELLNEMKKKGFVNNFQTELKIENDKSVYVEANSKFVYDEKGTVIGVEGMLRDITERKKVEEEIRAGEAKLRNIFDNSSDGIVLINNDGFIVEWSLSMEKMTGYTASEVKDRQIWDLQAEYSVNDIDAKIFKRLLKINTLKMLKGVNYFSEGVIFENKIRKKSGEIIYTQSTLAVLSTPSGNMILAVSRDVSVLKEAQKQLFIAKEEAEKSNRLKSEFLAQMSHEIRTPINSILSFSGLMEEELRNRLSTDLQEGFRVMKTAGNRIIRTIDLILNMSEIQSGTYEYVKSEIDLYTDILINISAAHKNLLKSKGLELLIQKPSKRAYICADEYTVNQIFSNLIDNAIKYSLSGKIEISFIHEGNDVIVKVKDEGIGISQEYLPSLFEPFTQEEQGYTRKFEGNGLGLSLVKKYCQLNNAEITVESKKNVGTVFTVTFKDQV